MKMEAVGSSKMLIFTYKTVVKVYKAFAFVVTFINFFCDTLILILLNWLEGHEEKKQNVLATVPLRNETYLRLLQFGFKKAR